MILNNWLVELYSAENKSNYIYFTAYICSWNLCFSYVRMMAKTMTIAIYQKG